LHIAVIDVGKLENLGWAVEGSNIRKCGTDIDACVDALAEALVAGPLALVSRHQCMCPIAKTPRNSIDAETAKEIVLFLLRPERVCSPRDW